MSFLPIAHTPCTDRQDEEVRFVVSIEDNRTIIYAKWTPFLLDLDQAREWRDALTEYLDAVTPYEVLARNTATTDKRRRDNRERWVQREKHQRERREAGPPPRTPEEGIVYLIEAGGHYKIGKTKDLNVRLKALNCGTHLPLTLVHQIKTGDMASVEEIFHEYFAEKRIKGEWFALSADDVQNICSVKSYFPAGERVTATLRHLKAQRKEQGAAI